MSLFALDLLGVTGWVQVICPIAIPLTQVVQIYLEEFDFRKKITNHNLLAAAELKSRDVRISLHWDHTLHIHESNISIETIFV